VFVTRSVRINKAGSPRGFGEFDVLERTAKQVRPILRANILKGFESFKGRINLREVEALAQAGRFREIEALLPLTELEGDLRNDFFRGLRRAVQRGGDESAKFFRRVIGGLIPAIREGEFAFSLTRPEIQAFLNTRTASLVQGATVEVMTSIRQALTEGFDRGLPPRIVARRVRNSIGLTPRQVNAVHRFQEKLLSQEPISAFTPFQREGMKRFQAPADRRRQVDSDFIRGLTPERAGKVVDDYEARQLTMRSRRIARTEAHMAVNFAQDQTWSQAIEEGLIDKENTRRRWIINPLTACCAPPKKQGGAGCICRPMAGVTAEMGQPFTLPDGRSVMHPPAHPHCNCAIALDFVRPSGA